MKEGIVGRGNSAPKGSPAEDSLSRDSQDGRPVRAGHRGTTSLHAHAGSWSMACSDWLRNVKYGTSPQLFSGSTCWRTISLTRDVTACNRDGLLAESESTTLKKIASSPDQAVPSACLMRTTSGPSIRSTVAIASARCSCCATPLGMYTPHYLSSKRGRGGRSRTSSGPSIVDSEALAFFVEVAAFEA